MRLFDTHCHLDLPELALDAMHWAQQALAAGVTHLLVPAVSPTRWSLQQELHAFVAAQLPHMQIHLALGVHPWWVHDVTMDTWHQLEQQLQHKATAPIAVGECGLDFALDWLPTAQRESCKQQQIEVFREQVALAKRYQKPLILHHRKSQPELLAVLKQSRFDQGGILHAFSGSQTQAQAFLDLGFKLGIGGTISYERAEKTRHTVQRLPLTAFVLETDAPSMPLSGFQGQLNHPAMTRKVFEQLCQLRHEQPADIAEQLWRNSFEVLQLPSTWKC